MGATWGGAGNSSSSFNSDRSPAHQTYDTLRPCKASMACSLCTDLATPEPHTLARQSWPSGPCLPCSLHRWRGEMLRPLSSVPSAHLGKALADQHRSDSRACELQIPLQGWAEASSAGIPDPWCSLSCQPEQTGVRAHAISLMHVQQSVASREQPWIAAGQERQKGSR